MFALRLKTEIGTAPVLNISSRTSDDFIKLEITVSANRK